ncbi:hypothetical protein ABIC83_002858 [Roseateles asaccharophilus]|uniref:hypothetical protein n=1 Tax=Roseateles asaccharophilus TaxID=582607 RepID=UPI003837D5D1
MADTSELNRLRDHTSPYAPIRLRNEFWWQFARGMAKEGHITPSGAFTHAEVPNMIFEMLVIPAIKTMSERAKAGEFPMEAAAQISSKFFEQRHWVPLIAQYELNGREIFDMHDVLTEMLQQTDVAECTLGGLRLPFDAFYIRFGKLDVAKADFGEGEFEYVDGAFVAATPWDAAGDPSGPYRLKIGLTTVKEDGTGVMMPGYFLDFMPEEQKLPVDEAIDAAMKRRIEVVTESQGSDQNMVNLGLVRAEEIKEGAALMRGAIGLVINALFYLESLKEIPPHSVGRDTSPALTAKWLTSKPERRHKLKSELTSSGYTVVRLVGSEIADAVPGGVPSSATKRTHWRRGYYREQACGPRWSERRRQWIRPTIVNQGKSDPLDLPGHVYVAGAPGNQ